ncbi:MAG TPA: class F sortase [Bacillales bacterium]|nr:class F sortase [Bacillales bacterium]
MRKWILPFVGACLLVLATGCGETSQASDAPKTIQKEQQQDEQPDNQQGKMNKQEKKDDIASPIEGFDWKVFSKEKEEKAQQSTQTAKKETEGIIPVKIRIPAINVKTEVIKKGLVKEGKYKGHMATPDNAVQTAWFKLGPKPGEKGAAIIAGHVDTYKGPGVFFNLEDMESGDLVYITGEDGKTLTFKVFKKKAYPKDDVPLRKVFGYTPAKVVELITCTGDFIESEGTHNKRLVVSAVLMEKDNSEKGKS